MLDNTDILAMHDLLARYGHVVDAAEWERLGEVFSDDGVFDLEALGR